MSDTRAPSFSSAAAAPPIKSAHVSSGSADDASSSSSSSSSKRGRSADGAAARGRAGAGAGVRVRVPMAEIALPLAAMRQDAMRCNASSSSSAHHESKARHQTPAPYSKASSSPSSGKYGPRARARGSDGKVAERSLDSRSATASSAASRSASASASASASSSESHRAAAAAQEHVSHRAKCLSSPRKKPNVASPLLLDATRIARDSRRAAARATGHDETGASRSDESSSRHARLVMPTPTPTPTPAPLDALHPHSISTTSSSPSHRLLFEAAKLGARQQGVSSSSTSLDSSAPIAPALARPDKSNAPRKGKRDDVFGPSDEMLHLGSNPTESESPKTPRSHASSPSLTSAEVHTAHAPSRAPASLPRKAQRVARSAQKVRASQEGSNASANANGDGGEADGKALLLLLLAQPHSPSPQKEKRFARRRDARRGDLAPLNRRAGAASGSGSSESSEEEQEEEPQVSPMKLRFERQSPAAAAAAAPRNDRAHLDPTKVDFVVYQDPPQQSFASSSLCARDESWKRSAEQGDDWEIEGQRAEEEEEEEGVNRNAWSDENVPPPALASVLDSPNADGLERNGAVLGWRCEEKCAGTEASSSDAYVDAPSRFSPHVDADRIGNTSTKASSSSSQLHYAHAHAHAKLPTRRRGTGGRLSLLADAAAAASIVAGSSTAGHRLACEDAAEAGDGQGSSSSCEGDG